MAAPIERVGKAALFLLGADTGYSAGSFSLSAPQTTEWRVKGIEGADGSSQEEIIRGVRKWVWVASLKVLAYTGFTSLVARSWWALLGGLMVAADMHASYEWAIRCGRNSPTPGGKLIEQALGVRVGEHLDDGRVQAPPSRTGEPQMAVRSRPFRWAADSGASPSTNHRFTRPTVSG